MIKAADIEAAARRLANVAVRTPLIESHELNERVGGRVLIKAECLQRTGSFKIRGAYNLMSQLSDEQKRRGVVAFSSGNHAQGVACAGRLLGIDTTIVMPSDAPRAKLDNTRRLGGEVITYDRHTGDREAIARKLATERGSELVPSYDHANIIAGQGTVGYEIAGQCRDAECVPDQLLVCCGGGGLTSGSAVALRDSFPDVRVHTVEPEHFDDTYLSLQTGERVAVSQSGESICDALMTPTPGKLTFDILKNINVTGLVVSEQDVRHAMRFAFQQLKLVVEPGGAVALAAVLEGRVPTQGLTTVAVISGGNVDKALFTEIQAEPN